MGNSLVVAQFGNLSGKVRVGAQDCELGWSMKPALYASSKINSEFIDVSPVFLSSRHFQSYFAENFTNRSRASRKRSLREEK
jgi:hypothetical protein